MSQLISLARYLKSERYMLKRQLELLESGKFKTGENHGYGWIDTTTESIKRTKASLLEVERVLGEVEKSP